MEIIITIFKIMGLAWFVSRFDPIQWVLEAVRSNFSNDRKFIQLLFMVLETITTCSKCAAFWIGLVLYGIWPALIASFIIFWYDKIFLPIEHKITLPV